MWCHKEAEIFDNKALHSHKKSFSIPKKMYKHWYVRDYRWLCEQHSAGDICCQMWDIHHFLQVITNPAFVPAVCGLNWENKMWTRYLENDFVFRYLD